MPATLSHPPEANFIPYQTVDRSTGHYDAIVVGAGHHGLISAAFLARAGKRVLVLESRDVIGGMCWTREMDNAPGFRANPCSMEILLMGASPSIIDQLELEKYGLRFVYPTTLISGLFPDGRHVTFYKDIERTVAHFRSFSNRDAESYRELVEGVTWALKAAMPYLMGPASKPRPGALYEILKVLLKGRKEVARGARILMSPMDSILDEYFETEAVKVALGGFCLANFKSISDMGSGAYLSILTGAHEFGLRRPLGGTGQLSRSIAACINDHGGEIRVNAPVDKIIVQNGRAKGVALASGEEIYASQVIANVDPIILGTRLLDASDLPRSTTMQLNALKGRITPINVFKVDIALSARPRFSGMGHENLDPEILAALVLCQNMADWYRSEALSLAGSYDPSNMPITLYLPSIFDRALVPPGSDGEYLYLYVGNSPYAFKDGRDWASHKDAYFKNCLSTLETYAPGISGLVKDVAITAPSEFEQRYNNFCGNYAQVGMGSPTELGPWRPIPDFGSNKTPIAALWHASAGSHGVPYLNGWAGRTVAGEVIKALNKQQ